MSVLKIKDSQGNWVNIPAIKGADGKEYDDTKIKQDISNLKKLENIDEVGIERIKDIAKEITGELENLETEDKTNLVNAINEALNSGGGSDFPYYNLISEWTKFNLFYPSYVNLTDEETTNLFSKLLTDIYKEPNHLGKFEFYRIQGDLNCFKLFGTVYINIKSNNMGFLGTGYVYSGNSNAPENSLIYNVPLSISGRWSGDNYICNSVYISSYKQIKFLSTSNTTSYNVTNDYTPAHKKYVDDAIASAITTTLEGEY